MTCEKIIEKKILFMFCILIHLESGSLQNVSCGLDKSPIRMVYEGVADSKHYPWIGILYYPLDDKKLTTGVVLVTRQTVLASAIEIDRMPKWNFRSVARVVFGDCDKTAHISIKDYTYHPDFEKNTYSAMTLIQLDVDHLMLELVPICPPPAFYTQATFYSMSLSHGCSKPTIRIHKMYFVNANECKAYYRRSQLNVETLWPSYWTCARSLSDTECLWRSGTILVSKQHNRWRLHGFGIHGPGCSAPARFMDYVQYHQWVKTSITRIGRPAITRMGDDHVILRRKPSNIQRFGPCDREEMDHELFTDTTTLTPQGLFSWRTIRYNLTLIADVEYSCLIFKALHLGEITPGETPQIRLRRWCAGHTGICMDFQFIQIDFYVEITYRSMVSYRFAAYGRQAQIVDSRKAILYTNQNLSLPGLFKLDMYKAYLDRFNIYKSFGADRVLNWLPKGRIIQRCTLTRECW